MPKDPAQTPKTAEDRMLERLDEIALHLERMDRRDRVRMASGFVHSLLSIIPLLLTLGAAWYLYENFDEILRRTMREAAVQTMEATKGGSDTLIKQMQEYFKK